jgi:ATP-dependent Clp protease protease subunit
VKKYYSLVTEGREASVMIYGEITSWPWLESDVSSYTLSKEIEGLDVDVIHVYINSYGGEVAEALAICSALQRHKAKVKTYCDGFACSAAADVFMAGEERIMSNASLLFIHNVWGYSVGNANDLRKAADDFETITQASLALYLDKVNISEEELKRMFDEETWLLPQEALDMGFATSIVGEQKKAVNQSARAKVIDMVKQQYAARAKQPPAEPAQAPPAVAEPIQETIAPPAAQETAPKEPEKNKPMSLFSALMGGKEKG